MPEGKILFVDDEVYVLASLQRSMRNRFNITTANSGEEALAIMDEMGPFAVIVSDYQMPEMNGIDFLGMCQTRSPDSVRIMLTGQADMRVAIAAVNEGRIFQFLTKPCPTQQLEAALKAAQSYYEAKESERILLDKTLKGAIKVLFDILAMIKPSTFGQASRLRSLARRVAVRRQMTNLWEVELSALLALIGYVTIPDDILDRQAHMQKLETHELDIFQSHIKSGSRLVSNIPRLQEVSKAILYQQKCYDGSGMPDDNVQGEDIPELARLLKVVIDYDELAGIGLPAERIFSTLRSRQECYDPDFLLALENEMMGCGDTFLRKSVRLEDIQEGMVTIQPIYDERGRLVIGSNQEISPLIKQQLINYQKMSPIKQPILVLVSVIGQE